MHKNNSKRSYDEQKWRSDDGRDIFFGLKLDQILGNVTNNMFNLIINMKKIFFLDVTPDFNSVPYENYNTDQECLYEKTF